MEILFNAPDELVITLLLINHLNGAYLEIAPICSSHVEVLYKTIDQLTSESIID